MSTNRIFRGIPILRAMIAMLAVAILYLAFCFGFFGLGSHRQSYPAAADKKPIASLLPTTGPARAVGRVAVRGKLDSRIDFSRLISPDEAVVWGLYHNSITLCNPSGESKDIRFPPEASLHDAWQDAGSLRFLVSEEHTLRIVDRDYTPLDEIQFPERIQNHWPRGRYDMAGGRGCILSSADMAYFVFEFNAGSFARFERRNSGGSNLEISGDLVLMSGMNRRSGEGRRGEVTVYNAMTGSPIYEEAVSDFKLTSTFSRDGQSFLSYGAFVADVPGRPYSIDYADYPTSVTIRLLDGRLERDIDMPSYVTAAQYDSATGFLAIAGKGFVRFERDGVVEEVKVSPENTIRTISFDEAGTTAFVGGLSGEYFFYHMPPKLAEE